MNVLLIHGLGSSPNKERVKFLQTLGFNVVAPHIIYESNNKAFELLCDIVEKDNIQLVIGNSMGGRMAYLLSEKYNIPAICFNPALKHTKTNQTSNNMSLSMINRNKIIILGDRDTVVNNTETYKFLSEEFSFFPLFIQCGHQISQEIFERYISYALNELKF